MTLLKNSVLAILMCLIFGCNSTKKSSTSNSSKQEKSSVLKRKWILVELNNYDKKTFTKHPTFIDLSNKQNTGNAFAGCNNISFTYTFKDNTIKFSDIISTRMYCEETSKLESSLLAVLNTCKEFKIEGRFLFLTTESNETIKCIAKD